MKKLLVLSAVALFTLVIGCEKDQTPVVAPGVTLSQEETDDLLFLREEEKLARDVYVFAYNKYGEEMFNSISQSEQKHMDKLLVLINTYGLQDPILAETGKFSNHELQQLYDDLILKADISLIDAFEVGATVEDVDIRDIKVNISRTDKTDILDTYSKLECGSRNHMRGFTDKLTENGFTYTPQYISVDEYNAIINGTHENCGGH